MNEVMNIRQMAQYLGLSTDTLYKYASEGSIPAFKFGNRWRFKNSLIDKWMESKSNDNARIQPSDNSGTNRLP